MTLDDLIAAAQEVRNKLGGRANVVLMTSRGYSHPALVDGLGFASRDGKGEPVVIIGPGQASPPAATEQDAQRRLAELGGHPLRWPFCFRPLSSDGFPHL